MGTILYHGDFKPVYHESSAPPYENFTVKIPSEIGNGKAQINIAHFALVGVSINSFQRQTINRTWLILEFRRAPGLSWRL